MTTPFVTGLTRKVDQASEKAQTQKRIAHYSTSALEMDSNNMAKRTHTGNVPVKNVADENVRKISPKNTICKIKEFPAIRQF